MELYSVKTDPDTLEPQRHISAPKEVDQSKYHALKQMIQAGNDVDAKIEQISPVRERFDHRNQFPEDQIVARPPYRLAPVQAQEAEYQIAELLSLGTLTESDSAWSFPIVMLRKQDITWRMCIDYHLSNNETIKNSFPSPHIDDRLSKVGEKRFY